MTQKEAEQGLKTLINTELWFLVRATKKAGFKDEKNEIIKSIQMYEERLPEVFKQLIPDYHNFIIKELLNIKAQEMAKKKQREEDER